MSAAKGDGAMTTDRRVSRGEAMAAEALIERADVMGRPIRPEILEAARRLLRLWEEQKRDAAQKPIGNPA